MSEREIKPALTREEWARKGVNRSWGFVQAEIEYAGTVRPDGEEADDDAVWVIGADESIYFDGDDRHALAALCLHGQPFGFTWEDVDLLQEAAIKGRSVTDGPDPDFWGLADRIEALLPPRKP